MSDYVRLYALYHEGGIYFDTDVEVVRPFDPLLSDSCFVGFQQEREHADWVNNAVIGSIPGHHFVKRCMDFVVEKYNKERKFYRSPEFTTSVLEEMGLSKYGMQVVGGVKLYPTEYFYPYPWWGEYYPDCVQENTYCIHHWDASWKKKGVHNWLTKTKWGLLDRILRT